MIVSEVPYYKQEEWYTCGPACPRMLLKYIGTSAAGILYGGIQGFGHFIVITGFDNNNITYHDPDIPDGQDAKCSIERFMQAWSALKCWVIKLQKVKQ